MSYDSIAKVRNYIGSQRSLTIFVAMVLAIPISRHFESTVGGLIGRLFLLVLIGATVPTAYEECWPRYDEAWKAVAWVLVAAVVVTTAFIGIYLAVTSVADLPFSFASFVSYFVTHIGAFRLFSRLGDDGADG